MGNLLVEINSRPLCAWSEAEHYDLGRLFVVRGAMVWDVIASALSSCGRIRLLL